MTDRNELLQRISAQLDKYGNWDEGCFYYNGTSCAELGALDNEIKEAIAAPTEGGQGEATFAEWLATEMPAGTVIGDPKWLADRIARSEEHTSELQSLMRISYAVFCLKKKT